MVLLRCHGCSATAAEIAEALDIAVSDLFDEPLPARDPGSPRVGRSPQQRAAGKRRGRLGRLPARIAGPVPEPDGEHVWSEVTRYPYTDVDGTLVQEVIREECTDCGTRHKRFRQLFVGPNRTYVKRKPAVFTPVLFAMPQLHAALSSGQPVWLLEGEKDVETALGLGLSATTNAQGGLNFPPQLAEVFTAAVVRVVLDRDGAGYDRGIDLASLLGAVAADVQLLLPATTTDKSDFTDHVEAELWRDNDVWHGFVPVSVGEVAAHAALAKLRGKSVEVEKAAAEAAARVERGRVSGHEDECADEMRLAQRWAVEAERLFEPLSEAVDAVRGFAAAEGTAWSQEAVDAATTVWRTARTAARGAHDISRTPIPPLLHDEDERAAAQSSGSEGLDTDESHTPFTEGRRLHVVGGATRGAQISAPTYRVVEGNLVEIVTNRDGEQSAKMVLSIDARIVEMEYLESQNDGLDVDAPILLGREDIVGQREANPPSPEQLSAVVIGYTHPDTGEFMRMRVDAQDYRDCTWVDSLPGPPTYDSKPSGIAKLRDALKVAGGLVIARTVRFRSTGWRKDRDDEWFYVHAGGAISASGARVAPVLLSGPLSRYDLPCPIADATRLRDAFMIDSGSMLTRLPVRVSAPLLGHVFRAALGPNPWVLTLVGSPGSYKTSIASIAMHHFGELWDRRRPASSMSGNGDTLNALRIKLNSSKDALYWADDVAPTRDWGAAQKALEEFARMVHNGEQRSRSSRDGLSILDGTAPRSSAMVTSEVMPRPGSGAQRMLVVPLQSDEIELDELIRLDDERSRHGRALLMASFLQWLCPRLDEIREKVFVEGAHYAESLREQGETVRQAEAVGAVWAGWQAVTAFLLDVGALDADEVERVLDAVDGGLHDAVIAAADPDLPSRTGARVRELLAHALRTGLAYVDDVRTGEAPARPLAGRLGWRRTLVSDYQDVKKYREDARGIRLGYVLTDPGPRDGEAQLLVESTALEQVLKAAASTMSDAPQIDRGTALRALYDEGVLIAEERAGKTPRYTVQRTIHCEERRQRMTALRLWAILGDGPDDGQIGVLDTMGGPDDSPDDNTGGAGESSTAVADLAALFSVSNGAAAGATATDTSRAQGAETTSDDCGPEETPVGSYADADGHFAAAEHISPSVPCLACGVVAGLRFDGHVLHAPCWLRSTASSRAALVTRAAAASKPKPSATTQPAETQPAAATRPSALAERGPAPSTTDQNTSAADGREQPLETTRPRRTPNAKTSVDTFAAPAAVLDVDGIWMPDGSRIDLSQNLSHVGHIADLVSELRLGTQTSSWQSEPGQIWVTAAMTEKFGVDLSKLSEDPSQRRKDVGEATAGTAFVTDAIADGWALGKPGDRLGAWTRVWRTEGEHRGVWVVLAAGMNADPRDIPILGDLPSPSTLARRLSLFASALKMPWVITPQSTGFDLMISTRFKDRERMFGPHTPVGPASISSLEDDYSWSRKPTGDESSMAYVHAYDRGGSHAAGIAGLEMGIGAPTHHPDGREFDKKLPGYWRVEIPEAGDWRIPHPLLPLGGRPSLLWVTTPSLQVAEELGYDLTPVVEAYVWNEHGRVLDPWYERIRDARTALDIDDVDAQLARDLLKGVYTRTIGQMGSSVHMTGRAGFSPERRHHIIAKARANITRRIVKIGTVSDRWPVAITNDTVLYTSNDPDPLSAWPGESKHLGRGFGQYKWEGSARLDDHLDFLVGGRYKGKEALATTWDRTTGGEG
ncbi:telomere-binding protein [Rhodococcoides fascians]|uniref:telomere-binding protein n=1 Tax=Rhodococcoides fascians TaxID=1828 RepID=UPI00366C2E7C